MGYEEAWVTYFRSGWQSGYGLEVQAWQMAEFVKTGRTTGGVDLSRVTADVRSEQGEEVDRLKREAVPAVAWARAFPGRRSKRSEGAKYSGLMSLDVDAVRVPERARNVLGELPFAVLSYVSVGGKGVKLVVAVDPVPLSNSEFESAFGAVLATLPREARAKTDARQRDSTRLGFLAYDRDAVVRFDPTPIDWSSWRPATRETRPASPPPSSAYSRSVERLLLNARMAPPRRYQEWLACLVSLKACGVSVEAAERWTLRQDGPLLVRKHWATRDCVRKRWSGIRGGSRNTIFDLARFRGVHKGLVRREWTK